MTSRISLVKLIKEEFRHHIVSIFAVVLTFLAEILFFYFEIQRLLQYENTEQYYRDVIAAAGEPYVSALVPVIVLAVLLAVEYFNYLHSQKKTDFYMSLPLKRKEQFQLGMAVCGIIFIAPCIFAAVCECLIGYASGYGTALFLQNMIWNFICKLLTFLACFVTMALAMIMTGNLVIAAMGFGAFCSYVPVFVKWLIPVYENLFFDTHTGMNKFSDTWNYFSPISLSYGLVKDYENWTIDRHLNYLIVILIFIFIVGLLAQILYVKRPAEAAGRAMAFTKVNSIIRFLVVIPIALYCGYFLQQTAPDGAIGWLFVGTIIGVVLLHGIMESIFRFDLRGMFTKKKHLVVSAFICCVFIVIFQTDIIKYDEFIPDIQDIESVEIKPNANGIYFYDDMHTSKNDGIYGETVQDVIKLVETLVAQNDQLIASLYTESNQPQDEYIEIGGITVEYQMKNGSSKAREYYVDLGNEEVRNLLDKICSTEEFKNDYYALYGVELEDIMKITLDNIITIENLLLSEEEQKEFFEIYLQELTELTFTEMEEKDKISKFRVNYNDSAQMDYYTGETYIIYEHFDETIAFLAECGIEVNGPLADYELLSIEFYEEYVSDTEEKPGFIVEDPKLLEEVKNELLLIDLYDEGYVSGVKNSRYATIEILVNGRISSYDVYVRPQTEKILESAAQYRSEQ